MKELETIKWQLQGYQAVLARQVDRLYNALEELQRTTLLLRDMDRADDDDIDRWLEAEGFAVDDDGFFQSLPLASAFRQGRAPEDAISFSWGRHLEDDPAVRRDMYRHRNIGPHLKHIRDRLGDVGWIYYQSVHNAALQFPFIDQCTAIPWDFDWSTYHTYMSVAPGNNPERRIAWTPPSIDYAGEGLIVGVSIPIWHGDAFVGLWSIDLPLRYLYRDFASSNIHPDQSQFIVNREGMLLLHEKLKAEIDQSQGQIFLHPLSKLGGQWAHMDMGTLLNGEDNPLEIKDAAGDAWLFCFSHMPSVGWTLFSGLPRSSMEEASAQRFRQAFEQIAAGNFAHRIEPTRSDTLPILVDAFNEMSQRLNEAKTNHEEMEKQLRVVQKLEAIGRLAGGVAHDFNNITNVIMGYSEMALGKIGKDDPFYKFFNEIYEAARRAMELTRQLLAFARRQSIAPKVLDINKAVNGMIKMLDRMIGEDVELAWRPGEGVWHVEIDPSQIDQVLANLCVNARDAIDSVGHVIIETANTEFDRHYCSVHRGFIPGEFVQITVTDDGKGMDAPTLDAVMQAGTKSAASNGDGLGLSIVSELAAKHGFELVVESQPGAGTSMALILPPD
jgi:signal transduction histidine kinase